MIPTNSTRIITDPWDDLGLFSLHISWITYCIYLFLFKQVYWVRLTWLLIQISSRLSSITFVFNLFAVKQGSVFSRHVFFIGEKWKHYLEELIITSRTEEKGEKKNKHRTDKLEEKTTVHMKTTWREKEPDLCFYRAKSNKWSHSKSGHCVTRIYVEEDVECGDCVRSISSRSRSDLRYTFGLRSIPKEKEITIKICWTMIIKRRKKEREREWQRKHQTSR